MAVDLAAIEARLHARLAELADEDATAADSTAPVALDQDAVGRLSRIDAMQVQAMALAARERRVHERRQVQATLARLHTDEFGWCSVCGEAIAEARLMNDPTAVRCIGCAA